MNDDLKTNSDSFSASAPSFDFIEKEEEENTLLAKEKKPISFKENSIYEFSKTEEALPLLKKSKEQLTFKAGETPQPSHCFNAYTLRNRRKYNYGDDIHQ